MKPTSYNTKLGGSGIFAETTLNLNGLTTTVPHLMEPSYSVQWKSPLQFFDYDIRATLTHEALSTPAPSYLVSRDLPARPAPDRFESCEEVRVLLQ